MDILTLKKLIDDRNYRVYAVETGWHDLADCIDRTYDLVITNAPNIVLPSLIHKYLALPWTSNDHSYNHDYTPGFKINPINIDSLTVLPNIKYINTYQLLYNEIKKHNYNFKHIHVLSYDIASNKIIADYNELEYDTNVIKRLVELEQKDIDQKHAQDQQKEADMKLNQLISDISKLSIENKQKVLAKLIK